MTLPSAKKFHIAADAAASCVGDVRAGSAGAKATIAGTAVAPASFADLLFVEAPSRNDSSAPYSGFGSRSSRLA